MGGYLENKAFQLSFDGRYQQNHNEPITSKGIEYLEANWWRTFKQYQAVEIIIDIGLSGLCLGHIRDSRALEDSTATVDALAPVPAMMDQFGRAEHSWQAREPMS